eukprot:1382704-Pyramimonas_sp.AAC.1
MRDCRRTCQTTRWARGGGAVEAPGEQLRFGGANRMAIRAAKDLRCDVRAENCQPKNRAGTFAVLGSE